MRIAVIPCYNEEKTISEVVSKSLESCDKVIVVDNNSQDDTILKAKKAGAEVILCGIQGAGATTRTGINHALKYCDRISTIITLDGDGQHDPNDIDKLASRIDVGIADICIGSRFLNIKNMPFYRMIGNRIISMDYNYYSKHKLNDTQSCFRAFNTKVAQSINIEENGFGFSTEFLVKARKLGFRITEVSIECIYHEEFSQNSTLNPIKHGVGVLLKTEKWRLKEDIRDLLVRF